MGCLAVQGSPRRREQMLEVRRRGDVVRGLGRVEVQTAAGQESEGALLALSDLRGFEMVLIAAGRRIDQAE